MSRQGGGAPCGSQGDKTGVSEKWPRANKSRDVPIFRNVP